MFQAPIMYKDSQTDRQKERYKQIDGRIHVDKLTDRQTDAVDRQVDTIDRYATKS